MKQGFCSLPSNVTTLHGNLSQFWWLTDPTDNQCNFDHFSCSHFILKGLQNFHSSSLTPPIQRCMFLFERLDFCSFCSESDKAWLPQDNSLRILVIQVVTRMLYSCYAGDGKITNLCLSCFGCVRYHQTMCAWYSENIEQSALVVLGTCYRLGGCPLSIKWLQKY